jgi:hypothetical protein
MAKQSILTAKKLIALDPAMVRQIENYRFNERIKSESQAIRRLIELGLEAQSLPKLPTRKNPG